jgi:hypothetical protein
MAGILARAGRPRYLSCMRMSAVSALVTGLFLVALAAGCRREAPVNGIGGFEIGKTQLGSLSGRCFPASDEPLMLCPSIAAAPLADQKGNIDLYFGGKTTDSTLIEILLDVAFCRPEPLEAFLIEKLGQPKGRVGKRAFWSNEYVYISAALPADPTRCEINFVSSNDKERIATLSKPGPEAGQGAVQGADQGAGQGAGQEAVQGAGQ